MQFPQNPSVFSFLIIQLLISGKHWTLKKKSNSLDFLIARCRVISETNESDITRSSVLFLQILFFPFFLHLLSVTLYKVIMDSTESWIASEAHASESLTWEWWHKEAFSESFIWSMKLGQHTSLAGLTYTKVREILPT